MTKREVKGKYQKTLNEKYEMYLNSMRRIINTHTHIKQSSSNNIPSGFDGKITVYCKPLGT